MRRTSLIVAIFLLLSGCRLGHGPSTPAPLSIACPERFLLDAREPGYYRLDDNGEIFAMRKARQLAWPTLIDADGLPQTVVNTDSMYSKSGGRRETRVELSLEAVAPHPCSTQDLICPTSSKCPVEPGCQVFRQDFPSELFEPAPTSLAELHAMLEYSFVDEGNCSEGFPTSWCRRIATTQQRRQMSIIAGEICAFVEGSCDPRIRALYTPIRQVSAHYRIDVRSESKAFHRFVMLDLEPPLPSDWAAEPVLAQFHVNSTTGETEPLQTKWSPDGSKSLMVPLDLSPTTLRIANDGLLASRRLTSATLVTSFLRDGEDLEANELAFWAKGRPPYQIALGDARCERHVNSSAERPDLQYTEQLQSARITKRLPRTDPLLVRLSSDPRWLFRWHWLAGYTAVLILAALLLYPWRNRTFRSRPSDQ